MATPNAARHHDLEQRLRDMDNSIRDLGSLAMGRKISPVFAKSQYAEDNAAPSFGTSTQTYWASPALGRPPQGYSIAHISVQVSAGASFGASSGNLTVAPYLDYDTASGNTISGPAINSGNSNIAVANSFWSYTITGLTQAHFINLGLGVIRGGDSPTPVAGSCNWHLSASIIFLH
ncbi:hypothetical protein SAMN05428985_11026 [Nocardioides sp. YR527]|uniref:hypothetical protein n=1 Tax=Nocardioides sp. YR527 TaxID=1881028 RepID=UPI00089089AE|nr:hypothetical protein [Nocardioides sp. YR527]SDL14237.1 hypothetical protein SAMN05428985_11026 [Nocardioides sp. YR527]